MADSVLPLLCRTDVSFPSKKKKKRDSHQVTLDTTYDAWRYGPSLISLAVVEASGIVEFENTSWSNALTNGTTYLNGRDYRVCGVIVVCVAPEGYKNRVAISCLVVLDPPCELYIFGLDAQRRSLKDLERCQRGQGSALWSLQRDDDSDQEHPDIAEVEASFAFHSSQRVYYNV